MRRYAVAVLPGDGIGAEVTAEALRVLDAASTRFGFAIDYYEAPIGQAALDAEGRVLPPETLRCAREADAVLVGPLLGDRHARADALSDPKQGLIKLRAWLGSYATVRPIRTYACLRAASPLRPQLATPHLTLVYDHSSGLFYGRPHGREGEPGARKATNTMIYTEVEIARTAHVAFDLARRRGGRVLSVDMAKLLETGRLWAEVVAEVGKAYPEVPLARRDAQHFFYDLPADPAAYDVVLSEMSLGHLIAATAAGLTGTFAIHPVAYLGGHVPLFQPGHGAAPIIAGRDLADPIGMIRTAAMMLEWGLEEPEAAAAIEAAVEATLAGGAWPAEIAPDLGDIGAVCACDGKGSRLGTRGLGEAVCNRVAGVRGPTAPRQEAT